MKFAYIADSEGFPGSPSGVVAGVVEVGGGTVEVVGGESVELVGGGTVVIGSDSFSVPKINLILF